jgi:2-polyprenyl-6-methoxyphenol hydroxylase-like FAD-dependent oxidoreductase
MPDRAPVLIVGAGPVGLSLALGLARGGVQSVVIEKNASTSEQSRAPGIWSRTLEIFDGWGVVDELLAAGAYLP